jgi:hypothetical protein
MQIYPIAVVYEMELTVCDNRFGRRQIKQYSVAVRKPIFTSSPTNRIKNVVSR